MRHPRRAAREINKLCHSRGGRHEFNPRGTPVLDADWDNLVILDACRYDVFDEVADLPGTTESRYSKAAATYEFIRANFADRRAHDVVYVGANTWYLKLRDQIDAEIHRFVDLQHGEDDVEWANEELNVVTPETVTRHAERVADEHPDKRLIVHYLQPHHPFIGPTGKKHFTHQSVSLLDVVGEADASDELLRQAYRENLELVLPEVRQLLETLQGRTVVTADHGEMLGDRHRYVPIKDYGHHPEIFNDPTTKVPWHVYTNGPRKELVSEPPVADDVDMAAIDEQLENLGYKL